MSLARTFYMQTQHRIEEREKNVKTFAADRESLSLSLSLSYYLFLPIFEISRALSLLAPLALIYCVWLRVVKTLSWQFQLPSRLARVYQSRRESKRRTTTFIYLQ